ncbi:hypothetical protein Slin15195_G074390 [Septoria linicola]|uniref:Uncharacterized protein n=1 Tax=Septoria linicola TaxID=215465 RepID=A0A9Q9EKJ5_9PEZI|nr:hypothetical protein Slin15195_G074390 [Septoria linicola]
MSDAMSPSGFYAVYVLGSAQASGTLGGVCAVLRSSYHILRRSPVRPSFLRTTGIIGSIPFGLSMGVFAVGRLQLGSNFAQEVEEEISFRPGGVTPELLRQYHVVQISTIAAGASLTAFATRGAGGGKLLKVVGAGYLGAVASSPLGSAYFAYRRIDRRMDEVKRA